MIYSLDCKAVVYNSSFNPALHGNLKALSNLMESRTRHARDPVQSLVPLHIYPKLAYGSIYLVFTELCLYILSRCNTARRSGTGFSPTKTDSPIFNFLFSHVVIIWPYQFFYFFGLLDSAVMYQLTFLSLNLFVVHS